MANRRFFQFTSSLNAGLTLIEGSVVIDSGQSGKIRNLKGSGIKSIKNVSAGTYKVQLEETYARYLGGFSGFVSSVTGNVAIASNVSGTPYVIRTLGNTSQAQFEAAGVPVGVPAAVGLSFIGTGVAATGTATLFTVANSGITSIEVIGDPNLTINALSDPHIKIQTLAATSSSVTTLVPTDPVDNSVLGITLMLRNSSVKGKGE